MKLDVTDAPDDAWDEYVRRLDGNVYHTAAWAEASRRPGGTPLFLTWRGRDGEPAAIAVAQLQTSRAPLIGPWNGLLSLASLPAVHASQRAHGTEVLAALDVESHMAPSLGVDARALGAVARERIEFRLDLEPSEEQLWAAFGRHHRRKINKAGRHGMTLRDSTEAGEVGLLRQLQKGSRDRRRGRGEDMVLGDDSPVLELMERMLGSGLGRLFLAESGGDVVSGALLSEFGGRAYYVFGGSNETGFRLDAPGALFWHMIRHYKTRSFVEFNLGGVPAGAVHADSHAHGLYRFKAGFGAREVVCCDYGFDLRPVLSAAIRIAARAVRRR